MPNVMKVLKAEISRISRKEAKAAIGPVRKPSVKVRRDMAALKRRMASTEKAVREIQALLNRLETAIPTTPPEQTSREWISGRGIKSLRKRLGLSQVEFAQLVGVSAQAVCVWESKAGMLTLRKATKAALFAVRNIGAREAKNRLAKSEQKKPAKKRR